VPRFSQAHKELLDSFLLNIPGVSSGKMFGYPAYFVWKKMFACVYGDGVGLKLPEALANELIGRDGITFFQPMGRHIMREWVQINRAASADYLGDMDLFEHSVKFVAEAKKD